jgi:hypothetical protein
MTGGNHVWSLMKLPTLWLKGWKAGRSKKPRNYLSIRRGGQRTINRGWSNRWRPVAWIDPSPLGQDDPRLVILRCVREAIRPILPDDPRRGPQEGTPGGPPPPEIRPQAGVAEMQADDMVKLDTVHGSPGLVSRYLAPDGQAKKIPRSCDRPAGGTKEFIRRTHSQ